MVLEDVLGRLEAKARDAQGAEADALRRRVAERRAGIDTRLRLLADREEERVAWLLRGRSARMEARRDLETLRGNPSVSPEEKARKTAATFFRLREQHEAHRQEERAFRSRVEAEDAAWRVVAERWASEDAEVLRG